MTNTGAIEAIDLMDLRPFIEGTEHALFRELRDHAPVHWNPERSGPGFWSLTRYDDIVAAGTDWETFSNADGTQILSRRVEGKVNTLHNMDPPRHAKLRSIMTPHLRAVSVRQWQEIIDLSVNDILDQAIPKGEVDFVHAVAARLPIRVLGQVIGVPAEDCDLLLDWTNRVVSDDPEFMRTPDEKERARAEMFAYFEHLTEERRRSPRSDLISVLVRAAIDGELLSWEDLAAYYFVLVGAGNETTRNLISGSVIALDENPDQYARLRKDPSLVGPAVEELLRHFSPLRAFRRNTTRDVEIHGQTIRKGDKVVLWFESANRDDRVFPDPNRLILDRTPNEHLAFGWGIHACMGSHLARAEAATVFRTLSQRGVVVRPTGPPDRLHSNQFHGIKRLPVAIEPGAQA